MKKNEKNSTNSRIKLFPSLLKKEDKESLSKFVNNPNIPKEMRLTLETLMTDKKVNFETKETEHHFIEVEITKNSKNPKHGLKNLHRHQPYNDDIYKLTESLKQVINNIVKRINGEKNKLTSSSVFVESTLKTHKTLTFNSQKVGDIVEKVPERLQEKLCGLIQFYYKLEELKKEAIFITTKINYILPQQNNAGQLQENQNQVKEELTKMEPTVYSKAEKLKNGRPLQTPIERNKRWKETSNVGEGGRPSTPISNFIGNNNQKEWGPQRETAYCGGYNNGSRFHPAPLEIQPSFSQYGDGNNKGYNVLGGGTLKTNNQGNKGSRTPNNQNTGQINNNYTKSHSHLHRKTGSNCNASNGDSGVYNAPNNNKLGFGGNNNVTSNQPPSFNSNNYNHNSQLSLPQARNNSCASQAKITISYQGLPESRSYAMNTGVQWTLKGGKSPFYPSKTNKGPSR